jgi:hypothetical protein
MKQTVVTPPGGGKRNRVPTSTAGGPRCASCRADLAWLVDGREGDSTLVHPAGGRVDDRQVGALPDPQLRAWVEGSTGPAAARAR